MENLQVEKYKGIQKFCLPVRSSRGKKLKNWVDDFREGRSKRNNNNNNGYLNKEFCVCRCRALHAKLDEYNDR